MSALLAPVKSVSAGAVVGHAAAAGPPVTSPAATSPHITSPRCAVVERVQNRLRESSYYYLRAVTCEFDRGVLTLRGRVPTFYLKQTVQALAEKVDGVRQVVNLVDVVNPGGVS